MTVARYSAPLGRATFTSSAKTVFRRLAAVGSATRPDLCEALNLSRPTMSAAMEDLERIGYVEKIGERQGVTGRKAGMYRLGPGAGHILAIDAGSTHIRLRAGFLDGRTLHSRIYPLPSSQRRLSAEISRVVARAVDEVRAAAREAWGPLRALGIALPSRVVDNAPQPALHSGQDDIFSHFVPPDGVAVLLENNVNCAAIAENNYGAAVGLASFAYIQIGLKIGMGVVLNGELVRGRNGAAGEIGSIPFPWAPDREPRPEELENYLGAAAFMQRVWSDWPADGAAGEPPVDSAALFELAERGNAVALSHVRRHAENIGRLVAACVAIIDPGTVVLGGGIGQSLLMLPYVREAVGRLTFPTGVEVTTLGADATLLGISKIASEHALESLMRDGAG